MSRVCDDIQPCKDKKHKDNGKDKENYNYKDNDKDKENKGER